MLRIFGIKGRGLTKRQLRQAQKEMEAEFIDDLQKAGHKVGIPVQDSRNFRKKY